MSFSGAYPDGKNPVWFGMNNNVDSQGKRVGSVYSYIEFSDGSTKRVSSAASARGPALFGAGGFGDMGGADSQSGDGLPQWMRNANTAMGAFGLANSTKTEIIDHAIRQNYKSARTYSEFNKLRPTQQAWRTTNTLGKAGAQYLKYSKGLGYVGASLTATYSIANAGVYYYNGGGDWQVGAKATLDVVMTGVGFLGPIGFGVSATYFILDNATGNFGGFGQIKP